MTVEDILRPNGKPYRSRKVAAYAWENDDNWSYDHDCTSGVVVLGTHDVERATVLAREGCQRWFGLGARFDCIGWWRLGYHNGDPTWIRDEDRGRAGVWFTAVEEIIEEAA